MNIDVTKSSSEDAHTVRQLVERLAESSPKRHRDECAGPLRDGAARQSIPDDRAFSPDVFSMSRGNIAPISADENPDEDVGQPLRKFNTELLTRTSPSNLRDYIQRADTIIGRLRETQETPAKPAGGSADLLGVSIAPVVDALTVITDDTSHNHVRRRYKMLSECIQGPNFYLEELRKVIQKKEEASADNNIS